jgi:hypothetical protein
MEFDQLREINIGDVVRLATESDDVGICSEIAGKRMTVIGLNFNRNTNRNLILRSERLSDRTYQIVYCTPLDEDTANMYGVESSFVGKYVLHGDNDLIAEIVDRASTRVASNSPAVSSGKSDQDKMLDFFKGPKHKSGNSGFKFL